MAEMAPLEAANNSHNEAVLEFVVDTVHRTAEQVLHMIVGEEERVESIVADSSPAPRLAMVRSPKTANALATEPDEAFYEPGLDFETGAAPPAKQRQVARPVHRAHEGFIWSEELATELGLLDDVGIDESRLNLSEKAVYETSLRSALECEFTIDEEGRIDAVNDNDLITGALLDRLIYENDENEESQDEYLVWKGMKERKTAIKRVRNDWEAVQRAAFCELDYAEQNRAVMVSRNEPRGEAEEDIAAGEDDDQLLAEKVSKVYQDQCEKMGMTPSELARSVLLQTVVGKAQSLEVNEMYLGNRGAIAFLVALGQGGAKELLEIDLSNNGVGNEAVEVLASILPRLPKCYKVDLSRNAISEPGAKVLIKLIQSHPCLYLVDASMNPIPSYTRVRLKEVLSSKAKRLGKA